MSKTNIFLTGATGYIGGSVLARLIERSDFPSLNITALVRSEAKASKLQTLGINTVVGSHDDSALVTKLASDADVVIATADCDNEGAARAVLAGLKKRFEATKVVPTLIHTSGTGVLSDNAAGEYIYDIIYDDLNPAQIETLAPTQPHRPVDLLLVDADKQGFVRTYIILPSTIYAIASNKLVDLGIQNPYSIQVPALIDTSLDRGQAGMVGHGKNLWPNVHIDDVADLYIVLYDAIKNNPSAVGHGREGFYFGENGEHKLYDVSQAIAVALVEQGRGKSAEPTTFTKEEINKYFDGSNYLGSNSRCRANRSRAIGWKPKYTTADFLASIKPEVAASLLRKAVLLR